MKNLDGALMTVLSQRHPMKIFGMNASKKFAEDIAKHLGMELTPHIEKNFLDGECYIKSPDGEIGNVRGHDVFVIQSLYSDETESVADKFMKMCIFIGSLRQACAHEVIAVIPHLAWARQDRKTESRAPVTTKILSVMLESVGIDHSVFMDVHNLSAEQNAFSLRTPIDCLESKNLHAQCIADMAERKKVKRLAVMTPDGGGYPRATRFANALSRIMPEVDIVVVALDKIRSGEKVYASKVVGDVRDADVVIYDDMISSGGTMGKAAKQVVKEGGRVLAICVTHGLFVGNANEVMDELDCPIVIADTVPPFRLSESNQKKVVVVSTTQMFASAIKRIHSGTGSISELLR
jgi:ribose-phosphate pyrophosphokinase